MPVRGQRNKVRFFFDPARAAELDHWRNAHVLHDKQAKVDSLQLESARLDRIIIGQQARLNALRSAAQYPSLAPELSDSIAVPNAGTLDGNLAPAVPSMADSGRTAMEQQTASIEQDLATAQRHKEELNSALEAARSALALQKAISSADASAMAWPLRFARGIRTLELGSCTPQGSEFLMNGTTIQGVSFKYMQKDLFVAFDHGRSFDDTWRNTDPVQNGIRQVQQSLFLIDAQDLAPRRLTDLRVGAGSPEGTHLHVGYLYGKRNDLTEAGSERTDVSYRTNHVVEFDAGLVVKKGHTVRLVHARSVVVPGPLEASNSDSPPTASDLFTEGAAQAWKATWTSDLERTRTRVAAEGRYISPWFQSFGMGFLRSGSKAAEARIDQSIGQRLRLRAKGSLEQRTAPNTDAPRTMELARGQFGVNWKPLQVLALNATYLPVVSQWEAGPADRTDCYQFGADIRKRWRGTVLFVSATSGLYHWQGSFGNDQRIWNQGMNVTLTQRDRLSWGLSYTMLATQGVDTVPAATNLGIRFGYRTPGKLSIEASAQVSKDHQPGWTLVIQRPLNEHFALNVRGEQYANYTALYNVDPMANTRTDQAWSMSISYKW
ncbi:MAG: hypothetical protein JNL52_03095 [Flavobacteriales bacterium]|nr:hypothetical protein [Flavobacteriales bacterium]